MDIAMKLSQITPLLASGLLCSSQAMAQERPVPDHSTAVTIEPFQLFEPNLSAEYENNVSDKSGVAVGIQVGKATRVRSNGEGIMWFLGGSEQTRINTMGVNSSYNYYVKNFNRGWYGGLGLMLYRDVEKVDSETNSTHNVFKGGPHVGYKIATEGGFTFVWDMGLGYQTELGESTSKDGTEIIYLGLAGMGKLSFGYSF